MELSNQEKQDKKRESDKWLEEFLGLDEEEKFVRFQCKDCSEIDEVPEYIIGEFSVDLKPEEEVEIQCPKCNGTMTRARNVPSD